VLRECTAGADEGRLGFAELVVKLAEVGVDGYYADFRRAEKTYYTVKGRCHVLQTATLAVTVAPDFSAEALRSAIKSVVDRAITYVQFCDVIAAAGCVGYFVSLTGRRVIYYGKRGESHVEPFEMMG
jgi:uncharacterized protein YbcV (DUF1398 family)